MKACITAFFGRMAVSLLFSGPLFLATAALADDMEEAVATTVPEAVVEHEPRPLLIASMGFEYLRDATVPGQESIQKNVPFGLARVTDDYIFEIYVPYIQRTAPQGKVARSHHHESAENTAAAPLVSSAGLGDITTSLQLPLTEEKTAPIALFAKGEIKFATADVTRGLGTGANDYSIEFIAKHAAEKYRSEASIGYANLGSPGTVEINDVKKTFYYRNIYFGSLSGIYHLDERLEAGLRLELGQAAQVNGPQQRDLSAVAEYKISAGSGLRMELLKSIAPGLNLRGFSATLLFAL